MNDIVGRRQQYISVSFVHIYIGIQLSCHSPKILWNREFRTDVQLRDKVKNMGTMRPTFHVVAIVITSIHAEQCYTYFISPTYMLVGTATIKK